MRNRRIILAIVAGAWLCGLGGVPASAWFADPPQTELDDRPEPLVPKKEKTAEDRDRIESLSLFAAARTEEQRGNFAAALKLYQRSLRLEPQSRAIVDQIIEVAQELGRVEDVVRYTILALELDPSDPRLEPVAERLVRAGEFNSALKLYQRARELQKSKTSAEYLMLTLHVGQLSYLTDRREEAADAFVEVMRGLENDKLPAKERKLLQGEGGKNYELFGAALLMADRVDAAREAFAHSQEIKPDRALAALHTAQLRMKEDQSKEALESLDTFFDFGQLRADATAYELLAEILSKLDRSDELLPRLEKLEKANADDEAVDPLRLFLAEKLLAADKPEQAAGLYAALHKKKPTIEIYQGLLKSYAGMGDADRLAATLAEIHEKAGGLDLVGDPVKELACNEKLFHQCVAAVDKLPTSSSNTAYHARLALGLVAIKAEEFDLATKLFEQAIKAKPRSREVWREWGLALVQADRCGDAVDVFHRGIDSHVLAADDPLFHTYLTVALVLDKRYDEALDVAKEAAEIGEHSAPLESRIPWVLYHAKRYDEAVLAYEELIERFEEDRATEGVGAVLREARITLSNICVTLNKLPEAEEWLEQVLDEHPNDVGALNDLGYLWADQGKHLERALRMVQQAVDAEPDNIAYRDSLGWAFYRLGRYPEAIEQLEKATAGDKPDGVITDHLGDAYAGAKQMAKARAAWKRAIEALEKESAADKDGDAKDSDTKDNADKIAKIKSKLKK